MGLFAMKRSETEKLQHYAGRMKSFLKNRQTLSPQELEKYQNQWVAWSMDGTRIVAASKESDEAVYNMVVAAGLNLSECVFGFVPDPEVSHLGL